LREWVKERSCKSFVEIESRPGDESGLRERSVESSSFVEKGAMRLSQESMGTRAAFFLYMHLYQSGVPVVHSRGERGLQAATAGQDFGSWKGAPIADMMRGL
jgi:hypothetical protein